MQEIHRSLFLSGKGDVLIIIVPPKHYCKENSSFNLSGMKELIFVMLIFRWSWETEDYSVLFKPL